MVKAGAARRRPVTAGPAALNLSAPILAVLILSVAPLAAQDRLGPDLPPTPPEVRTEAPAGGAVVRMGDDGDAASQPLRSPVLTVNDAALFAGSAWGRRVQAEVEVLSEAFAAENDRIYDDLAAEEEELTELRATLPPAQFRELAEAFDHRAQTIRAERQSALRDLNEQIEAEQRGFYAVAVPIFAEVMAERGALVILDQRTVFVSADSVDVTAALIARIDAEIGAGPVAPQPEDAPEAADSPDNPAANGGAPDAEAAPAP